MKNEILLRRFNCLEIQKGTGHSNLESLLNMLANFERLGFSCSPELCELIQSMNVDELQDFYSNSIDILKHQYGAKFKFKPMYPNFPQQVQKMSENELYHHAFMHYLGDYLNIRLMPHYDIEPRKALNRRPLTLLTIATGEELPQLLNQLLNRKQPFSEQDTEDLSYLISIFPNQTLAFLPQKIAHKEVMATICALGLKHRVLSEQHLKPYIQTATDLLRLMTALSDGDVSLASNTRFKSFSKAQRRIFLSLLDELADPLEDLFRHREKWKRVIERLHPFEYATRYPQICQNFKALLQNEKNQSFNREIEKAFAQKECLHSMTLLKQRPGEFARRLQHAFKLFSDQTSVLQHFISIIDRVPTPLLLQLRHYYQHNRQLKYRTFFPKGKASKIFAIRNELPPLDPNITSHLIDACSDSLRRRFALFPALGNCYLDPNLKNYSIPFTQRAASKSLKTIAQGSRLNLDAGNILRFFIYWQQGEERVDVDLSALAFGEEHKTLGHIAFYNLKENYATHSGDITSAPDGASEFIDIDIERALAHGVRSIMMSINSYTSQDFCDLPICFAGFMMRDEAQAGEIYEPTTVQHKFDVASASRVSMPFIIDLEQRQVLWTDIVMSTSPYMTNTVFNHLSSLSLTHYALTEKSYPNLYDLFDLHIQARGKRVDHIHQAESVFSVDEGIRPTDLDKILAEYL